MAKKKGINLKDSIFYVIFLIPLKKSRIGDNMI